VGFFLIPTVIEQGVDHAEYLNNKEAATNKLIADHFLKTGRGIIPPAVVAIIPNNMPYIKFALLRNRPQSCLLPFA
jgi:hypothetical protein